MVSDSGRFHLLEVGLTTPVESFIGWKLEGLARRGVRVSASATPSQGGEASLAGVEWIGAPRWDEAGVRFLVGLIRDLAGGTVRVALRSPSRLWATIRAACNPIRDVGGRSLLQLALRLRSYLPLALVRPDVVHFEWNMAAIHHLPMAEVWRCPTVVSCHGSDVNLRPHAADGEPYSRWLRESFERVSAAHCVSEAIAARAVELGMSPRRAWLIRSAVDPDFFRPADRRARTVRAADATALRVITVADFRWLKAHEHSVRAIACLTREGVAVTLEIVGTWDLGADSDRERVERAIARESVGERVSLIGAVSSAHVRERLQAADVLLHSSLTEGLPTAVLEAMACGLPVVVSDCGGVREAVRDGIDGFVVPVRGVSEAADALRRLHREPSLRATMGQAGRKRVEAHFSLAAQLESFITMYEAVLRGEVRSSMPPAVADAQLRVLSAGPLSWRQGFDDAMHAVRIVREAGIDCRQRILGDGPYLNALRFVRHQLELEPYVELRTERRVDWGRQLEWADVIVDASLADPPPDEVRASRTGGLELIRIQADPDALAQRLISIAAARGLVKPEARATASTAA